MTQRILSLKKNPKPIYVMPFRTKRATCYDPRWDPRRNKYLPAPAATQNFERRHLMDDQLFNHYYKKVKATGKDTYKEDLQNYRFDF